MVSSIAALRLFASNSRSDRTTGAIVAKLYNNRIAALPLLQQPPKAAARANEEKVFEAGDKITQIVILPIPEVELEQTNCMEYRAAHCVAAAISYAGARRERGEGGFGSSGR